MHEPSASGFRVAAVVAARGRGSAGGRRGGGVGAIKSQDLREWLTYISSDELQGRAVFTAGFGLAAAYIEDHLRAWGVKPAGDHGSYLQTVRVLGVKTTSHSTVTVTVNGETRTFADGDGITFPRNMGGKRRVHGRSRRVRRLRSRRARRRPHRLSRART